MRVFLFTKDRKLKNEVEEKLPKGFRLSGKGKDKEGINIVDIDTTNNLKDITERNITIAITRQGRTEIVIEATASGAYEVIRRPVKRRTCSGFSKRSGPLKRSFRRLSFLVLSSQPQHVL